MGRPKSSDSNKPAATQATREKFEELASIRVSKVLDSLDVLKKLANPKAYKYDSKDWDRIIAEISKKVVAIKTQVANPEAVPAKERFKL